MSVGLVFLHGVGGGAAIWAPQVEHFSQGRRVLAWNAPGYGGTPLPARASFAGLADRLAEDMTREGLAQAVVIGHSLGGMVAQQLVRDRPDRVAGLVLSGTSPAFGNPDGDFQRAFVAARTRPLDEGRSMADVAAAVVPTLMGSRSSENAMDLAVTCMSDVPEETYRTFIALLATFDLRRSLADISVPALLVAGTEDGTARADMMERMAGRIPDARFEVIEGAGHLMPLERPGDFNKLIEDFVTERIEHR